jgi:hypothetical protein
VFETSNILLLNGTFDVVDGNGDSQFENISESTLVAIFRNGYHHCFMVGDEFSTSFNIGSLAEDAFGDWSYGDLIKFRLRTKYDNGDAEAYYVLTAEQLIQPTDFLENQPVIDLNFTIPVVNPVSQDAGIRSTENSGCTNPLSENYDSCALYQLVDMSDCGDFQPVYGCTDGDTPALNYDATANFDDGSCVYDIPKFEFDESYGDNGINYQDSSIKIKIEGKSDYPIKRVSFNLTKVVLNVECQECESGVHYETDAGVTNVEIYGERKAATSLVELRSPITTVTIDFTEELDEETKYFIFYFYDIVTKHFCITNQFTYDASGEPLEIDIIDNCTDVDNLELLKNLDYCDADTCVNSGISCTDDSDCSLTYIQDINYHVGENMISYNTQPYDTSVFPSLPITDVDTYISNLEVKSFKNEVIIVDDTTSHSFYDLSLYDNFPIPINSVCFDIENDQPKEVTLATTNYQTYSESDVLISGSPILYPEDPDEVQIVANAICTDLIGDWMGASEYSSQPYTALFFEWDGQDFVELEQINTDGFSSVTCVNYTTDLENYVRTEKNGEFKYFGRCSGDVCGADSYCKTELLPHDVLSRIQYLDPSNTEYIDSTYAGTSWTDEFAMDYEHGYKYFIYRLFNENNNLIDIITISQSGRLREFNYFDDLGGICISGVCGNGVNDIDVDYYVPLNCETSDDCNIRYKPFSYYIEHTGYNFGAVTLPCKEYYFDPANTLEVFSEEIRDMENSIDQFYHESEIINAVDLNNDGLTDIWLGTLTRLYTSYGLLFRANQPLGAAVHYNMFYDRCGVCSSGDTNHIPDSDIDDRFLIEGQVQDAFECCLYPNKIVTWYEVINNEEYGRTEGDIKQFCDNLEEPYEFIDTDKSYRFSRVSSCPLNETQDCLGNCIPADSITELSAVIDQNGNCCLRGNIDECGVCYGDNACNPDCGYIESDSQVELSFDDTILNGGDLPDGYVTIVINNNTPITNLIFTISGIDISPTDEILLLSVPDNQPVSGFTLNNDKIITNDEGHQYYNRIFVMKNVDGEDTIPIADFVGYYKIQINFSDINNGSQVSLIDTSENVAYLHNLFVPVIISTASVSNYFWEDLSIYGCCNTDATNYNQYATYGCTGVFDLNECGETPNIFCCQFGGGEGIPEGLIDDCGVLNGNSICNQEIGQLLGGFCNCDDGSDICYNYDGEGSAFDCSGRCFGENYKDVIPNGADNAGENQCCLPPYYYEYDVDYYQIPALCGNIGESIQCYMHDDVPGQPDNVNDLPGVCVGDPSAQYGGIPTPYYCSTQFKFYCNTVEDCPVESYVMEYETVYRDWCGVCDGGSYGSNTGYMDCNQTCFGEATGLECFPELNCNIIGLYLDVSGVIPGEECVNQQCCYVSVGDCASYCGGEFTCEECEYTCECGDVDPVICGWYDECIGGTHSDGVCTCPDPEADNLEWLGSYYTSGDLDLWIMNQEDVSGYLDSVLAGYCSDPEFETSLGEWYTTGLLEEWILGQEDFESVMSELLGDYGHSEINPLIPITANTWNFVGNGVFDTEVIGDVASIVFFASFTGSNGGIVTTGDMVQGPITTDGTIQTLVWNEEIQNWDTSQDAVFAILPGRGYRVYFQNDGVFQWNAEMEPIVIETCGTDGAYNYDPMCDIVSGIFEMDCMVGDAGVQNQCCVGDGFSYTYQDVRYCNDPNARNYNPNLVDCQARNTTDCLYVTNGLVTDSEEIPYYLDELKFVLDFALLNGLVEDINDYDLEVDIEAIDELVDVTSDYFDWNAAVIVNITIDLSGGNVKIPYSIGILSFFANMTITNSNLSFIPSTINNRLTNSNPPIMSLDISGNGDVLVNSSLQDGIYNPNSLSQEDLFVDFSRFISVNISANNFDNVPNSILFDEVNYITELNISYNPITTIPANITAIGSDTDYGLGNLNMSHLNLGDGYTLPSELLSMSNHTLDEVCVDGYIDASTTYCYRGISVIDMGGNNTLQWDQEQMINTGIWKLTLNNNGYDTLPNTLPLTIQFINLNDNNFVEIIESLTENHPEWYNLVEGLSLSNNNLINVSFLTIMTKISYIDVSFNVDLTTNGQLTDTLSQFVPNDPIFGEYTSIFHVNLSGIGLEELPDASIEVYAGTGIRVLFFTYIPESWNVYYDKDENYIDISDNPFYCECNATDNCTNMPGWVRIGIDDNWIRGFDERSC